MTPTPTAVYVVNAAGIDNATRTTPSFTPVAGEVIAVMAFSGDSPQIIGACTNTGNAQTWALQSNVTSTNNCNGKTWTTVVGASPVAMTISVAFSGSPANAHGIIVIRWGNAKLAATPATVAVQGGTTGQSTITTVAPNSVVMWGIADWNAVTPGTPTYVPTVAAGTTQDQTPFFVSTSITTYQAHFTAVSTGSQAFGVSSPTGQKTTILAIEIQSSGTLFNVAASLGGTGTVGAAVTETQPVAVSMGGTCTVGANPAPTAIAASINSAATVAASSILTQGISAILSGQLTVAAVLGFVQQLQVSIVGNATVQANAVAVVAATMGGTCTVTAGATSKLAVACAITATGTVSAHAVSNQNVVAAISGVCTVSATMVRTRYLNGTASAVASMTFADILTRIRELNGTALATASLGPLYLFSVGSLLGARANGRSAAGEKPPRVVTTTGEADASAGIRGDIYVRIVQGYAEGTAVMTGNLINGAHYSPAVANATAAGNLKPVRIMVETLHADAAAAHGHLIRAAKMTDVLTVISEGSLFPDDGPGGLMGVHLMEVPEEETPPVVEVVTEDAPPPAVYTRTFMVIRP